MHLLTNFVVISFKHAKPTLYFRNMHKKKKQWHLSNCSKIAQEANTTNRCGEAARDFKNRWGTRCKDSLPTLIFLGFSRFYK